jgi:cob(I)alamin adenosyltransferase
MKIYTRTGDEGTTGLFGGGRVPKDHPRVQAYGTVDELNAVVGQAVALLEDDDLGDRLGRIQHDLFALGAVLATAPVEEGRPSPKGVPDLPGGRVEEMEAWIDEADEELPPLRAFILPGGSPAAASLHLARTVCRRAERAVVHLAGREEVDDAVLVYLNRLSDLLFAFARLANHRSGTPDVEWRKE